MLQLSRSGIRSLAANEAAYIRGVQYFRENKIIHAAWANTAKQYRLTVQGNYPYQVIIHVHDDGSFDTTCNCPAHIKEKGACKHIVASLLFLLLYHNLPQMMLLREVTFSNKNKLNFHLLSL